MQNPLDSTYCIATQIATAVKKVFYLYLQQTSNDGRDIINFRREAIGGKLDESIRRSCLDDMMLLTNQGSKEGITLLWSLSSRTGGVRNGNFMSIVYGWDDGEKVDLMLSLFFNYCLENPVMLESVFFNYKSLEDRDNVAELDAQLYGPYKYKVEGFYNTKTFQFSKTYQIAHRFNSGSPHDSTSIHVLTPDPQALISYIANNTGLIADSFEGGLFSTGLLFKGKRLEIVAGPKAVSKK